MVLATILINMTTNNDLNIPEELVSRAGLVLQCSEFVLRVVERMHKRGEDFFAEPLTVEFKTDEFAASLAADVQAVDSMPALQQTLRLRRNRAMARVAWRDIAGLADLDETLTAVTAIADHCLQAALGWLEATFYARYGKPRNGAGELQRLIVLGMGKQGGHELNFSSDIDLIYCYADDGETDGDRVISNHEFFTRLSQQLGKALNDITADGFVFRVDTRLRPFGNSGPLVASFAAMEDYYTKHGRDWERYAFIKARPVAGDVQAGEQLLDMLQPFVYRRYLDYGMIAALREMKAMINAEVVRKNLQDDIKRGSGGIREIEFIGQAFQLMRGGREPALQDRGIRSVLSKLATFGHMSVAAIDELQAAYAFHRRLENRLQQYRDQQTHTIPQDSEGQARLALAMQAKDWATLQADITRHRNTVRRHFDNIFAADNTVGESATNATNESAEVEPGASSAAELGALEHNENWQASWPNADVAMLALCQLSAFADAINDDDVGENKTSGSASLDNLLQGLYRERSYQLLSEQARDRLHNLLPLLALESNGCDKPRLSLQRQLRIVEAVMQRTVYLELLIERADARVLLARLCAASPWITDILLRYPILLDELLDTDSLLNVPDKEQINQELAATLGELDLDDLDLQMDVLRQFQKGQLLKVAAADVLGELPTMRVSDQLTWLAEAVLQQTLQLAWRQMRQRSDWPAGLSDQLDGIAVIAYGKLGGIELNYSSDLDVVFLLDDDVPTDAGPMMAKVIQRVMHLLQTRTSAGVLYEVDTRLRPNGRAGLLVTRMQAFFAYQRDSAWTWEHQALVRARAVAGDDRVAAAFSLVRQEILSHTREQQRLLAQVLEMRQKMRDELDKTPPDVFHLKQGAGGIVDIEFMVQHAVLQWSADYPELAEWTDNIRVLDALASSGLRPQVDITALQESYLLLRRKMHELALQNEPARVAEKELSDDLKTARGTVQRCWQAWLQDGLQVGLQDGLQDKLEDTA